MQTYCISLTLFVILIVETEYLEENNINYLIEVNEYLATPKFLWLSKEGKRKKNC